mmetsp:Transcript_942/g.3038  ORF Transcript_942/g.3038 Transcript_942/m.3038 type:complete len:211 (-) Transcript_942:18-650(-)
MQRASASRATTPRVDSPHRVLRSALHAADTNARLRQTTEVRKRPRRRRRRACNARGSAHKLVDKLRRALAAAWALQVRRAELHLCPGGNGKRRAWRDQLAADRCSVDALLEGGAPAVSEQHAATVVDPDLRVHAADQAGRRRESWRVEKRGCDRLRLRGERVGGAAAAPVAPAYADHLAGGQRDASRTVCALGAAHEPQLVAVLAHVCGH